MPYFEKSRKAHQLDTFVEQNIEIRPPVGDHTSDVTRGLERARSMSFVAYHQAGNHRTMRTYGGMPCRVWECLWTTNDSRWGKIVCNEIGWLEKKKYIRHGDTLQSISTHHPGGVLLNNNTILQWAFRTHHTLGALQLNLGNADPPSLSRASRNLASSSGNSGRYVCARQIKMVIPIGSNIPHSLPRPIPKHSIRSDKITEKERLW